MAKLEFNIKANKQHVDELYNSINRIKKLWKTSTLPILGLKSGLNILGNIIRTEGERR